MKEEEGPALQDFEKIEVKDGKKQKPLDGVKSLHEEGQGSCIRNSGWCPTVGFIICWI